MFSRISIMVGEINQIFPTLLETLTYLICGIVENGRATGIV